MLACDDARCLVEGHGSCVTPVDAREDVHGVVVIAFPTIYEVVTVEKASAERQAVAERQALHRSEVTDLQQ